MQAEIVYGLGGLLLVLALYLGVRMNRTRNRANDAVTDAAVRDQYKNPDGYDPQKFEQKLKP